MSWKLLVVIHDSKGGSSHEILKLKLEYFKVNNKVYLCTRYLCCFIDRHSCFLWQTTEAFSSVVEIQILCVSLTALNVSVHETQRCENYWDLHLWCRSNKSVNPASASLGQYQNSHSSLTLTHFRNILQSGSFA